MESSELDFPKMSSFTPKDVRARYRDVIPQVVIANPDLELTPQAAFDHIKTLERQIGSFLFGSDISPEASPLQVEVFNRKFFKLKSTLHIISEEEQQRLKDIDSHFASASEKLAENRGISLEDADNTLMSVLKYKGIKSFDDALERLTTGPLVEGFGRTELFHFDFANKDVKDMLLDSFGLEPLLTSRLLEITKTGGFPVQCGDTEYGNNCVDKYGATWEGGFLLLPDKKSYEEVEMHLEGISDVIKLEHTFKLRAATESGFGYALVKVREFVVEQPSHFDYLHDLPLSDEDKMKAYFLGIIAHETTHAIQSLGIDKAVFDEYLTLAEAEQSQILEHRFVSQYVDRHHTLYKSNLNQTINEDLAETVRIYLTNADYLMKYFPKRYQFIQDKLPYVNNNAIFEFISKSSRALSHSTPLKEST